MRAAGVDQFGAPVRLIELPEPRPQGPDEVLIEVRAAAVANWDDLVRLGSWEVGGTPPMALGVQASGVITAVGEEVSDWSVGDAVMTHPVPLRDQGTWAEQLIAAADVLAPKPDDVTWEEAAAFPVPALTAAQAVDEVLTADANDRVLVNGAGGVTGGLVAAVARSRGASVIAVAGPASEERLVALGVEAVLDYHDEDWPQAVRALTQGEGVSAAVNAVPGAEPAALSAVRDGGRFATITGGPPEPERGILVTDVYVRAVGSQLRQLARLLAERQLAIPVAAVYDLAQAGDALTLATQGRAGGAIVLTL